MLILICGNFVKVLSDYNDMARSEIVEKINAHLALHTPLTEECHVVYLMVEIRKMLEHSKSLKSSPMTFYCDWVVHTAKDGITDAIKLTMDEIYQSVRKQILTPVHYRGQKMPVIDFFYFRSLQTEMRDFFAAHGLDAQMVEERNWTAFTKLLVKILENQPINKPIPEVSQFIFIPAAEGCCFGRMFFSEKIGKYDYFEFGNAY